jgi:pyruvate dehydrogenase phosphatase regulatory subunit
MTCKTINVGLVSGIRAMRLTHTGEDGFMLYIPSEVALHVYDSLVTYGKNYGLRSAGYYALRALRTEKFFAYWGTDLRPQDTPLECGREYRVKFDTGGFIGYPALTRQRGEGIRKRLVQFVIEDHIVDEDPWPWGGEPIYRNGTFCGFTTSTAFGFGIDRHICLGYVHDYDPVTGEAKLIDRPTEFILDRSARYEINIAGKMFPARASIYAITLPPISESAVPL